MSYVIADYRHDENLYFRLESEHPVGARYIGAPIITITESIDTLIPHMTLQFADMNGDMFNFLYVNPEYPLKLKYGRDEVSNKTVEFLPAVNEVNNKNPMTAHAVNVSLSLASKHWVALANKMHSRGWENVSYSDVVASIAADAGASVDVEPSRRKLNVIQPMVTNKDFLKWIAERAVSEKGVAGYKCFGTLDGMLHFRTIDSMLSGAPTSTLYMSPEATSEINRIGSFRVIQNYAGHVNKATSGMNAVHFDFEKKEWISELRSVSNIGMRQKSDFVYLAKAHANSNTIVDAGRASDAANVADASIVDGLAGVQTISVHTHGDMGVRAGTMVKLLLKYLEEGKDATDLNLTYSGDWLVKDVTHVIDMEKASYQTYMTLMNFGINANDYKDNHFSGLAKTAVGRV